MILSKINNENKELEESKLKIKIKIKLFYMEIVHELIYKQKNPHLFYSISKY